MRNASFVIAVTIALCLLSINFINAESFGYNTLQESDVIILPIGNGTIGPQGPAGPQGPPGTNGTDGSDGINGINGTNGIDGINGTNGIDGINGTFEGILNTTQFYNVSTTYSINMTWLDTIYVRLSNLVSLVGNWTADKINYYTKSEVYNKTEIDNAGFAKYQFDGNNFNGSANFTTTDTINTKDLNWTGTARTINGTANNQGSLTIIKNGAVGWATTASDGIVLETQAVDVSSPVRGMFVSNTQNFAGTRTGAVPGFNAFGYNKVGNNTNALGIYGGRMGGRIYNTDGATTSNMAGILSSIYIDITSNGILTNGYSFRSEGGSVNNLGVLNNMINFYAPDSATAGSGVINNLTGVKIDKQTKGNQNNRGLWLNGNGIGADAVFGSSENARVYSDGTDLINNVTNGTLVLANSVYNDLLITPTAFDFAGVTDPTLVSYTPTGAGISTMLYEFAKNDIAYFNVQLPHTYREGTNISSHLHWTPGRRGTTEGTNIVGWKVQCSWANIDGTFGAISTFDLSDACQSTDDQHLMTPSVQLDGIVKNISSILICQVTRTDTGADDTWASSTSGQLPMILSVDFHYQIDTLGSRQAGVK